MDILGSATQMVKNTPHIGTGLHLGSIAGATAAVVWQGRTLSTDWQAGNYKTMAGKTILTVAMLLSVEATSRISALDVRKHVTAAFSQGVQVATHSVRFANNKLGEVATKANDWLAEMTKASAAKPAA